MTLLVYFSSKSLNTHRFVAKTGIEAVRIPIELDADVVKVTTPYILVVPSYSDGEGKGAVPKQVIRFLNDAENRSLLLGVIAGGNRNFGRFYGYAGDVISARCKVPCFYKFELMGTAEDVEAIKNGVKNLWQAQPQQLKNNRQ
jgi:protein involved in ribonucleotide reduction